MRSGDLVYALLAAIEAAELDEPDEAFVRVSLALLALAVSRLAPAERENALRAIEELGVLRQASALFSKPDPRPQPYPKVSDGRFH